MSCPPIITGDQFLVRTLSHIDCQAQLIGSYGYLALGEPGSLASTIVLGLLTVFIALFGIRLMFGPAPTSRDVVFDVIKIGLVLTLAFSWPTFRTVVYEVTLKAPNEITGVILAGSGSASGQGLAQRLQATDNAIAELTEAGAGRNSGAIVDETAPGASFRAAALEDDAAYGTGRMLFLASVIGSLALLRIAAGTLLALTPIVAALYFFPQTRGLFAGWLKGLVFTVAGSIGATVLLSVELAVLGPWLADALSVRNLGYATPSAPTELMALTLAFAIALLLMLWLLAKVTFYRGWLTLPDFPRTAGWPQPMAPALASPGTAMDIHMTRTERLTNSIERETRRDFVRLSERLIEGKSVAGTTSSDASAGSSAGTPRLGSSYRRAGRRPSHSAQNRDRTQ